MEITIKHFRQDVKINIKTVLFFFFFFFRISSQNYIIILKASLKTDSEKILLRCCNIHFCEENYLFGALTFMSNIKITHKLDLCNSMNANNNSVWQLQKPY